MTEERKGPTKIQAAFKMHEVPPEKWQRIFVRTIIGLALFLPGLAMALAMAWSYWKTQAMSLPLLLTGVGMVAVGAHMISGQMFGNSLKAVIGIAGNAKRKLLPGQGGDGA